VKSPLQWTHYHDSPQRFFYKFPKETYGKLEFLGAMDLRTDRIDTTDTQALRCVHLAGVQKAGGLDARHGTCSKD